MTEERQYHDDEPGLAVSPRFSEDLGKAFGPAGEVPADVDRAVAEAARRHFARRPRRLWWLRWTVPATAAAAILVTVCLWWAGRGPTDHSVQGIASPALRDAFYASETMRMEAVRADIDANGRVNILDAFALARHIESAGPVSQTWDINGDGLIDRKDVDTVAFAAVRLSKGV